MKKVKAKVKFKFIFYKSTGQHKFRWRIISSNGQIVCPQEGYLHKHGPKKTAMNLIAAIKKGQYAIEDHNDDG